MAAARRSVRHTDDDMSVDLGFAVFQRDITDQGQDFDLIVDRDFFIILSLPVKVTEIDITESTYSGKVTPADLITSCELGQSGDKLIALVKYQSKRYLCPLSQFLEFHERYRAACLLRSAVSRTPERVAQWAQQ